MYIFILNILIFNHVFERIQEYLFLIALRFMEKIKQRAYRNKYPCLRWRKWFKINWKYLPAHKNKYIYTYKLTRVYIFVWKYIYVYIHIYIYENIISQMVINASKEFPATIPELSYSVINLVHYFYLLWLCMI